MVKHANSDNKYIHILKTDTIKSNKLSTILKKKAESWVDNRKNDWTFEIENNDVEGPEADNEFSKFIDNVEEDSLFNDFFNADLTLRELKELCEYIYDEEVSQEAYNVIEETLEEEKEEFKEDYEQNPNNYPWGPGMDQKDFL